MPRLLAWVACESLRGCLVNHVSRREFVALLTIGAAVTLTGCGGSQDPPAKKAVPEVPLDQLGPLFGGIPAAVPGPAVTVSRAARGATGRKVAITIDDGIDEQTLAGYVDFSLRTGLPLTLEATGVAQANWESQARRLRPLIERGQVQIANHTWSHKVLTALADAEVTSEIEKNEEWINTIFGITARPYLRPPGGLHDARTDALAAQLGYTDILMWQGSYGDSDLLTPDKLLANAKAALLPGAIVIGHANHPVVLGLLEDIQKMIAGNKLDPVTVDDLLGTTRRVGARQT